MNILVADDDPTVLRLVVRVLVREGVTVVTAASGDELLAVWKTHRTRIVLSDVDMPGSMDGIQACMAIRDMDSFVYMFLMTGGSDFEARCAACRLPVILRKPFAIDELAAWVRSLPSAETPYR